jgi:hypothetical protein
VYAIHGVLFQPFRPGPGYRAKELRDSPGLRRLRLSAYPGVRPYYGVDGEILRVFGFGPQPEFYERLCQKHRLRRFHRTRGWRRSLPDPERIRPLPRVNSALECDLAERLTSPADARSPRRLPL